MDVLNTLENLVGRSAEDMHDTDILWYTKTITLHEAIAGEVVEPLQARIAALEAEVARQRDLLVDLAGDFPRNVASNARAAVKAYLAGDLDYQEALTASVRSGTQLDYAEWAEIRGIADDHTD